MAVVLPARAKRTKKGRFCKAKAFIRNNNAAIIFAILIRLSNCINETVTGLDCYFTYVVQTPSVERRIFVEQILRPTVAPEPREGEQSLMSTRRLLLNSHFAVYRNQTSEHNYEE